MIFAIIIVVASCIASIQCIDDCANRKCPWVPKHYEELGCKGIKDNDDCCVTRFECPDCYDSSKCYYKGKVYNVGDKFELPASNSSCICEGQPARIECSHERCPGFPLPEFGRCIWSFSDIHNFCNEKVICDESEIDKLAICYVDGKVYRSGERFYPNSQPCYECQCTDDYDNTTAVAENVNCKKEDCGIELEHLNDIRSGCVPMYYAEDRCCPYYNYYVCPTDNDQLKESDIDDKSDGPTCTFAKITLRIGQQLRIDNDECVECKCTIPPMVTCSYDIDCLNSRASKSKN